MVLCLAQTQRPFGGGAAQVHRSREREREREQALVYWATVRVAPSWCLCPSPPPRRYAERGAVLDWHDDSNQDSSMVAHRSSIPSSLHSPLTARTHRPVRQKPLYPGLVKRFYFGCLGAKKG